MANVLEVPVYKSYLNVGSLHVYERHWAKMEELAQSEHPAYADSYDLSEFVQRIIDEWKLR